MRLLRDNQQIAHLQQGVVATIGNFDGVHLGHQALLQALRNKADDLNLPLVVFLFEPQPSEYFLAEKAPARITSLREKLHILANCQVDYVYCLSFNNNLAFMPAEDFALQYFFSLLKVRYLLLGEDFRFGHQRSGDVALLKQIGEAHGCQVETLADFSLEGVRVSSTKIREALAAGQLDQAKALLGRAYSQCGRVVRGDGRGRQWGIPTANLSQHRLRLPMQGVFCVKVLRTTGDWLFGVANMGVRPTLHGLKNSLEVHLFDFNEDLYGELLQVFFLRKLRDEVKFSSTDALVAQIKADIQEAKRNFEFMTE